MGGGGGGGECRRGGRRFLKPLRSTLPRRLPAAKMMLAQTIELLLANKSYIHREWLLE